MLEDIDIRLARILSLTQKQIKNTIKLLDEGATIPFISRYRKEVTGGLTDTQLRELFEKLTYVRELDARRETILNSIREQGKLSPELENEILTVDSKTALEDIYLPYKPKRRTRAQIAKESGLEPLALDILNIQDLDIEQEATKYIDISKNIPDTKSALEGARYIIMEIFAENAHILGQLREKLWDEGILTAKVYEGKENDGIKFKDYFNYSELIKNIPSHRALALFRGHNEKLLSLSLTYPEQEILPRDSFSKYENIIIDEFKIKLASQSSKWLLDCVRLCFKAKIFPSIENELLNVVKENADLEAIKVFSTNLKNLLLQPPAGTKPTIGLDPGIRTGVKVAVMNSLGQVIDTTTIYPFQPRNEYRNSILTLINLIKKHNIELIAIGNGTASRETEKLIIDMLNQHPEVKVTKVMVSEAGASIYSASEYASKELPDLDVTIRGAVSIGRRLQDPLAELVKIDPKSIGVGQYQHDVNQINLLTSLNNVIEDCVNLVGVDVNTASVPLLARISGLNTITANNIINYRNQNGKFKNREELKNVSRLGEKAFEQCAGFLRIYNGTNKLDESAVHPESYALIDNISKKIEIDITSLINNTKIISKLNPNDFIDNTFGLPTVIDVLNELEKPSRDPRGEFITAQFNDEVHSIDDLYVDMELEGVITNVTNFGAFVDIGVHQDGLVHVSEITDKFIKDPSTVIKTGQIVKVRILSIDKERRRISLTMKELNKINQPNNIKNKEHPPSQNALAEAFKKIKM
ncbi:MAG: Tex family protein [Neisseriaceae bacterium]